MAKDVIIALDFPGEKETLEFLDEFKTPVYVKIGMELFYAAGPSILEKVRQRGHEIFLDLKFHDIPNTVAGAVRSVAHQGAAMTNLHASGGITMMRAAKDALEDAKVLLIAVTQLTSTDEETMHRELLIQGSLEEVVLSYANNAKKAGLDGVVCSALEVPTIKKHLGEDFITVTPGIRPQDASVGDQKRVVTPAMARELGSDYIVVGRPITKAEDPVSAYEAIKKDFLG